MLAGEPVRVTRSLQEEAVSAGDMLRLALVFLGIVGAAALLLALMACVAACRL
jgi:hypothetical protein